MVEESNEPGSSISGCRPTQQCHSESIVSLEADDGGWNVNWRWIRRAGRATDLLSFNLSVGRRAVSTEHKIDALDYFDYTQVHMKRIRSKLLIVLLAIGTFYSSPKTVWARNARCLDGDQVQKLSEPLKEMIKLRTASGSNFSPLDYDWDDKYFVTHQQLDAFVGTKHNLECMGFRLLGADTDGPSADIHQAMLSYLIAAFFLLDNSMLPISFEDSSVRPGYFHHTVGHTIKFLPRPNYAGLYNPLLKRISYSLFSLAVMNKRTWAINMGSLTLLSEQQVYSTETEWRWWRCGKPVPQGAIPAILHEYGHNIDFALRGMFWMGGDYSSDTSGWKQLHVTEYTSPYGDTSPTEDFAESFAYYFTDPFMKCWAPGKYNWFSQFVAINEEIYGSSLPYSEVDCGKPEIVGLLELRRIAAEKMKSCSK
ncbi:MAG: hypothetical protein A2428_13095 [Bdellovibrionales bacterium RIFOXYC1_FULL_54_43]|nr:MAG: hypothetical protein A2428_13095 [Bdellovibrionales bacterium RIFOXYC1_FULL_54_43]OFZ83850.1 MAG: hypothetical protein A2603_08965 [Bdellovibrionales bacterium RIFOXYD1_FULL_55_31]